GGPINVAAADEELLVNRLEQNKVQVARAYQVGETIAVFQEERLDKSLKSEVTADEKQVLSLAPAGNHRRLHEHCAVKDHHQKQPKHLDRPPRQEVAAEGKLAGQAVTPQGDY